MKLALIILVAGFIGAELTISCVRYWEWAEDSRKSQP